MSRSIYETILGILRVFSVFLQEQLYSLEMGKEVEQFSYILWKLSEFMRL